MELDLHRLELRFAATRISDAPAVQRLANSIEENGQLVECVAAGEPADVRPVLIDGYRRVAALRRLRRDTAQVQCWSCPVGQALAQVLARSGSRAFTAIEEAMLLRELIDAHGLTQRVSVPRTTPLRRRSRCGDVGVMRPRRRALSLPPRHRLAGASCAAAVAPSRAA